MCAQALQHAERTNGAETEQLAGAVSSDAGQVPAPIAEPNEAPLPQNRPLAIKTENLTRIYKIKGQKRSRSDKEKGKGDDESIVG